MHTEADPARMHICSYGRRLPLRLHPVWRSPDALLFRDRPSSARQQQHRCLQRGTGQRPEPLAFWLAAHILKCLFRFTWPLWAPALQRSEAWLVAPWPGWCSLGNCFCFTQVSAAVGKVSPQPPDGPDRAHGCSDSRCGVGDLCMPIPPCIYRFACGGPTIAFHRLCDHRAVHRRQASAPPKHRASSSFVTPATIGGLSSGPSQCSASGGRNGRRDSQPLIDKGEEGGAFHSRLA